MTSNTSLFSEPAKPLIDVKNESILVLDTNVLLTPYNISEQQTKQILQIYTMLVSQKRLYIPKQVVEEFNQNRVHKLTGLIEQLSRKRNSIQGIYQGKSLLLETLPIYQDIIRAEIEIDDLIKKYRKKLNELLNIIRQWNEGDPLTKMYKVIFDKALFDPKFNIDELQKEFEKRAAKHIPPGYKDAAKDNGGAGDFIIWRTILLIAEQNKKSVIFVTGDEKADWWHRAQKQPIYPRQELVEEFKNYSGGHSFYMIRFPEFLKLFGASDSLLVEANIGEITEREITVLELSQQGLNYTEIAKELKLNNGTVRNYFSNAYKKLGVKNKAGAIQRAMEYGLLKTSQPVLATFKPDLTPQEIRILGYIKQGYNNKKIAEEMGIGHGTVRNKVASAQKKLKAKNRAHAVQKAIELGILFPI